ncbi:hypothetical protein ACEPAI_4443 [Sanghuangporus weigelae]
MALTVDDSAAEWIFSTPEKGNMTRHAAGWHQLANDPLANANGYYNGTALWTKSPNATATLIFQGTSISLYSAKTPQGGQMNITCDWESKIVDLSSPELQVEMVWHQDDLDWTVQHAVSIQQVGEGRINIDSVEIMPGQLSPFPPAVPSPLPPAFPIRLASPTPSLTSMTSTLTMTMTMTMTATAGSDKNSSDVSLSKGAAVGIAVGLVVATSLFAAFLFICCKRQRNRSRGSRSRYTGLRRLRLTRWIGGRGYLSPGSSAPSFIQNEDREKAAEEMEERDVGGATYGSARFLPSIRRPSTLSIGQFSVSTPSRSVLTRFPPPPSRPSFSPSRSHRHNRSLAMTLSIDTNISPVQRKVYVGPVGASRVESLSRNQAVESVRSHRRTFDEFTSSDLTEEWQHVNYEKDVQSVHDEMEDAVFYAEHFGSRSEQDHVEEQDVAYVDDANDISPDTPLLAHSPAVASSNASLSHHNSNNSNVSRLSKGNKILRSLHSYSSKRSSLRRSFGKPSRRSSAARTPDARTPISKNSMSTSASDSPRSERHKARQSTLSVFSIPVLESVEPGSPSGITPPIPTIPENAQFSFPPHPPSSWSGTPPSLKVPTKLSRVLRPTGPRARSSSNASLKSNSSSSGGSTHSRASSRTERGELLSIVEEGSRSESSWTSAERHHHHEGDMDLLND